jgi:hypothetical protein
MRESRTYGSGRGARGNSRPYREGSSAPAPCCVCSQKSYDRTSPTYAITRQALISGAAWSVIFLYGLRECPSEPARS